jgi:hypothetical protein
MGIFIMGTERGGTCGRADLPLQPASHGPRYIVAPGSEMRHDIGYLPPVTGTGTVPGIRGQGGEVVGQPLDLRVQDVEPTCG